MSTTVDFNQLAQAGDHARTLDFSKTQEIVSGQTINFSKANPDVKNLRIELHWSGGADADASVVILGANNKALPGIKDVDNPNSTRGLVWYNNLVNPGISHSGDAREADDDPSSPEETIHINLLNVEPEADKLLIIASTFPEDDAGTGPAVPFSKVANCHVDIIDNTTNAVLYTYVLDETYPEHTSVELTQLTRQGDEWLLSYSGEAVGKSAVALSDIATKYGLV